MTSSLFHPETRATLERHRQAWEKKPLLRHLYRKWYRLISTQLSGKGPLVEIGGGSGNFKKFFPAALCSDCTWCPWLDVVFDGHALPFAGASVGDLVLIDVLHHLARPVDFLAEAQRVLVSGGRLLLLEPAITPWSWPVYRFLHPERVDFSMSPLENGAWAGRDKAPFEGNMAMATQLFIRETRKLQEKFPSFRIVTRKHSDFLLYPLSGGFDHKCRIPNKLITPLSWLERTLQPAGSFLAYRIFIVLEHVIKEEPRDSKEFAARTKEEDVR